MERLPSSLLVALLVLVWVVGLAAPSARADVAAGALNGTPLLVLEPDSGRVTLIARLSSEPARGADGRLTGRARIDRQPRRLRALGRRGRGCVAAVARQDGGTSSFARPLHPGRTYTARIWPSGGREDPVVLRLVLRAAREGDTRGEALGCA